MSVNDPVVVRWDPKREGWILIQGRETFYDEHRYLRVWQCSDDAIKWAQEKLGVVPELEK